MIKTILYLLVPIGFMCTLSSCEKAESFTEFEMKYSENITLSAGTPTDMSLDISTPEIQSNYKSVFDSYNTNRESIEEIVLQELIISVVSPSDANLNFLSSGEIKLSAGGNESGGIASFTNIENGAAEIEADTSGDNIKDYLTVDEFGVVVSLLTDEVLSEDIELEIKTVFFVDAKVLGQ